MTTRKSKNLRRFFTISSGMGRANEYILAFDRALRDAGFSDYNLIKVSSILPPFSTFKKEVDIEKGSLLPIAYSEISSNVKGEFIGAAVAVAVPESPEDIGVIMEVKGRDSVDILIKRVEDLCMEAMKDRGIKVKEVLSSGAGDEVKNGYLCVFAGVAIWESLI